MIYRATVHGFRFPFLRLYLFYHFIFVRAVKLLDIHFFFQEIIGFEKGGEDSVYASWQWMVYELDPNRPRQS